MTISAANLSAKYKIFIGLALWLVVSFFALGYMFKLLEKSSSESLVQINKQQKELAVLKNEYESFLKAQEDIQQISREQFSVDGFFSSDLTFVNEIKTFEDLAERLNLEINLSGISGTIDSLPKAETKGEIFVVPYRIALNGSFTNSVEFIENLENLPFITTISTVSLSAAGGGTVNTNLSGSFFLKKK
ncbi:MAG: hypothetical protein COT92_02925 [Candidatus Doudnabacteria bacterium CG10_big_fil_rev_8_21_14_0_10_42_18]|uniref:Pilus assembly protein PilO n=1 Tax=Candidatus Doudnabacteria bacterium CG10_big_fil_rev_8_21_14_0_10_42_18 TaxID=1974552 RepID=A0A2H0VAG5_9BACT|nr:MAG: hypothetical protein COT92_02925 [Candidatus Doudnabacteria bacterium CG10_big_fil_rev_8_21_14_0_10_42_18]